MHTTHHFTEEERAELLSNPYTARITDCKAVFTLEFKQFVMDHIDQPGMTAAKVFHLAGYSDDLFSVKVKRYIVASIRKEAASEKGLQEPAPLKTPTPKKKRSETELKELQERVAILEQQIDFLKKSQMLKKKDQLMRKDNSS